MLIICREVDKNSGRIAVYPLDIDVTDAAIQRMQLRARYNPELDYYVTTKAHYKGFSDVIMAVLKRKTVTEADIKRVGGIVQL